MQPSGVVGEDRLDIDTPENVAFGYDIAGLGSRFLAALIDTVIITLLQVLALVAVLAVARSIRPLFDFDDLAWLVGGYVLLSFVLLWGYYILFEAIWAGSTPGKRALKLRVIRRDGTPIGLTEAVVRNLTRIVDFLPAYYGLGVITIFADRQSRRLGDMAAGTLVVRERSTVSLDSLLPVEQTSATAPTTLSADDLLLVSEYLRRRNELANRANLARQIAERVAAHRGDPTPDDPDAYMQNLMS